MPPNVAAAVIEGWLVVSLGRRSVLVLSLVLGRLCERFSVDTGAVAEAIVRARAAAATPELRPS